jgi:hypothetical protein
MFCKSSLSSLNFFLKNLGSTSIISANTSRPYSLPFVFKRLYTASKIGITISSNCLCFFVSRTSRYEENDFNAANFNF